MIKIDELRYRIVHLGTQETNLPVGAIQRLESELSVGQYTVFCSMMESNALCTVTRNRFRRHSLEIHTVRVIARWRGVTSV